MDVERLAKLIARMHGSQMTYKPPGGEMMQTVASQHGFGHWGHSPDRYAEKYWERYVGAAQATLDAVGTFTADELATIRCLITDWGFEYSLRADRAKVRALARKVGMPDYDRDGEDE